MQPLKKEQLDQEPQRLRWLREDGHRGMSSGGLGSEKYDTKEENRKKNVETRNSKFRKCSQKENSS